MTGFLAILVASLFIHGIIIRTKSVFSGRKGPGLFQPLQDIFRLLLKGSVFSTTTSFIFRIAPGVYLASLISAALCIPFGNHPGLFSFPGDFVFFAYVLALGKFFMIIGALDTGSSFEGMGASREAHYSMLAEPAFFILLGSLALFSGHTSFNEIFAALSFESHLSVAIAVFATFVLFMLGMIENSRMPVDDPRTHLELTMVHEVMVLDHSGFDLGLIMFATNLKFAIYGALIANLFMSSYALLWQILIFLLTQVGYGVACGVTESFMARFRMGRNPQFIFTLSSYALIIFLVVLFIIGKTS